MDSSTGCAKRRARGGRPLRLQGKLPAQARAADGNAGGRAAHPFLTAWRARTSPWPAPGSRSSGCGPALLRARSAALPTRTPPLRHARRSNTPRCTLRRAGRSTRQPPQHAALRRRGRGPRCLRWPVVNGAVQTAGRRAAVGDERGADHACCERGRGTHLRMYIVPSRRPRRATHAPFRKTRARRGRSTPARSSAVRPRAVQAPPCVRPTTRSGLCGQRGTRTVEEPCTGGGLGEGELRGREFRRFAVGNTGRASGGKVVGVVDVDAIRLGQAAVGEVGGEAEADHPRAVLDVKVGNWVQGLFPCGGGPGTGWATRARGARAHTPGGGAPRLAKTT